MQILDANTNETIKICLYLCKHVIGKGHCVVYRNYLVPILNLIFKSEMSRLIATCLFPTAKCNIMRIASSSSSKTLSISYSLGSHAIEQFNKGKFLGVTVTDKLSSSVHISFSILMENFDIL